MNSRTVPNGQLAGSSWRSPHHEVLHFKAYSFLVLRGGSPTIHTAVEEMCTQGVNCPLIAHQERCGRQNCHHVTFKVEWVNPVGEQACTNSRTVPNGQLTGSSWQPPHHEVKVPTSRRTVSSLRELWIGVRSQQASVERPEATSCAPSGATPKTSTSPGGGEDPRL